MAPTVTSQRQEANKKSAMTFFPFFTESSDSSYFKTTDEIERLKMVIKSSVLIREKTKKQLIMQFLCFHLTCRKSAESAEKHIREFI